MDSGFPSVLSLCIETREGPPVLEDGLAQALHLSEGPMCWRMARLCLLICLQFCYTQGKMTVLVSGLALATHRSSVCACTPGRDHIYW